MTQQKTTRTSKTDVALWTLQLLAVVIFVTAGLGKLAGAPETVQSFNEMGFGDVGRYVIGTLELIGAAALLIPRLCGLAGLAFVGLMIGAIITSIAVLGPAEAAVPATVLIPVAVIAWGRRHRTVQILDYVRRS